MNDKYEWNFQELWHTSEKPNIGIYGVDKKRAKMKSKGIENLFHEIIAKIPITEKEVDTKDE